MKVLRVVSGVAAGTASAGAHKEHCQQASSAAGAFQLVQCREPAWLRRRSVLGIRQHGAVQIHITSKLCLPEA